MGIKDLLKFMKPYIKPIHIKKYAGKRVGIDAYSWLHKGAYSCSMELCLNSNSERKSRYLNYFMHRINLLRHYNVTPVVVFDGGNIPCKAATEDERHRRREANRDLAMEKLRDGNVKAASELFQRAISITPAMAHQLIQILGSENIEFVVAPYEADAQLAYLSSLEEEKGGIVAVITEDSDLIAYGCQATVFKMDRHGNGEELVLGNVFDSGNGTPSFRNFDKELFIGMCVLAGCDFLPSVPGIGISKAYSIVSKYRNLDRVLSVLKIEKGSQVPEDYSKSFREAVAVFQHARIYDSGTKKLIHIKPLPQEILKSLGGELDFLGPEMPPSVAIAIAEGRLDPVNMKAFDCFPNSEYNRGHLAMQTSTRLQMPEITTETGFMVFSSQKTMEEITVFSSQETMKEIKVAATKMKQDPVSMERKYFNEGAALQKLLLPLGNHETVENAMVPENIPSKVPDNNPFKRRKLDDMPFDMTKSISKEVLVATKDAKLDALCVTPDKIISEVPKNIHSRKRKLSGSHLNKGESVTEQVYVVTDVESSSLLDTMESQESVNSKLNRLSKGKKKNKNKKTDASNCNSSVNKRTSILNFFCRV